MRTRTHTLAALMLLLGACSAKPQETGHARSMSYVGDPGVVGTLEGPAVDAALEEIGRPLERCLARAPELDEVVIWLEIEEDGSVSGLSPGAGEVLPVRLAFCLQEAAADLQLPEPEGGIASVAVRLRR